MKTIKISSLFLGLLAVLLVGCARPTVAPAAQTYSDPFQYCAAIGAIDAPDARYTGQAVPDAVIDGFKQAAGLTQSAEPQETLRQTTIWRCMDGKVYACNFGANLPCDSKADTNEEPTQAMRDFCAQNAGADAIPMSVTGHTTIYSWGCQAETPLILEQIDQPDAAGYLSRIWYALTPED
jgi:hypothetical protein